MALTNSSPRNGFGIEGSKAELWTPMGLDPAVDYRTRTGRYLTTVARLKPGVSRSRAQTGLDAIARRLEADHPSFNAGWGVMAGYGMNAALLPDGMTGSVIED